MGTDAARTAILTRLAAGVSSAAEIARACGLSQPTLSRAMRVLEREQKVLRMGSTRGARYGLRRTVDAVGSRWPLYRIAEDGTSHELATVYALWRDQYSCVGSPQRVSLGSPQRIAGLFDGIPYYLQDARPSGFLGRAIPSAHPELELPSRVIDWTGDHFLTYVTRRGTDTPGNLIIGAESLDRHLRGTEGPRAVLAKERASAYPRLAAEALAGAPPGSSAQGEWPKFTACVADGRARTHVLVKFSPPRSTAAGERCADLLVTEYLAHRMLEEHGVDACRSALIEAGDRVFLECERFDRVGADGRRGVATLLAIDAARYGRLDSWTAATERLAADGMLSGEDARRIRLLDAFGALIANTDRHFANISFFDRHEGPFALAPAYDMLPMLFAPQEGQVIERRYEPAARTAAWLSVWPDAGALALDFWDRLSREAGLSASFRRISSQCLDRLRSGLRRPG